MSTTKGSQGADGAYLIGRSAPRLEDRRLLTGSADFVADLCAPRALNAVVVRSEHAHGDLLRIDARRALSLPGVLAVHTAADLLEDALAPLPCVAVLDAQTSGMSGAPLVEVPRLALASDRVRFVGEPLALVVAEDLDAARAASEQVDVVVDPLPAIADIEAALAPTAPALWAAARDNVAFHQVRGDALAVAKHMAAAATVIECRLVNNRVTAAPIEPRAGLALFDPATETFTLTATAQGLHAIRDQLAPVFGLPAERFVLRAPDVGGGFGLKNFLYPEWVLLTWAARHHGRPVRWCGERGEDMSGAAHGRDSLATARLALDAAGRFLALEADVVGNMGAYLSGSGPNVLTRAFPTALGGLYRFDQVSMRVRGVFTNTVPVDAYRGAGKPEANYLLERLIDKAARQLQLDPFTLRTRNAIDTFPHVGPMGTCIDSSAFIQQVTAAAAAVDQGSYAERCAASRLAGRARGLGVGCFLETARGVPEEGASLSLAADGTLRLAVGTESNGQGHETAFAQVAADRLGVSVEQIRFVQADTAEVPLGHGHGGARSMHMGGAALMAAAEQLLAHARPVAAELLQTQPAALHYVRGQFQIPGSGRTVSLQAVAAALHEAEPANSAAAGLRTFARVVDAPFTFPSGCHVAEVEVDLETGAVTLDRYVAFDDYGHLINPMLTRGQVHGGVVQGIGQALLENVVYAPESGQLLTGSFMDYALPRADAVPAIDVHLDGTPTTANVLGVKGAGQAGSIAAPQTVVSAVLDALAPHGVGHLDMPLTSERVWRALALARRVEPTAR